MTQEEAYFELLARCAIRTMQDKPTGTHTAVFWRERVGKAWRGVYQHMTKPSTELAAGNTVAYRRTMALRFAALSREAAMAAWSLTVEIEGDGAPWSDMAAKFEQMGKEMSPLL